MGQQNLEADTDHMANYQGSESPGTVNTPTVAGTSSADSAVQSLLTTASTQSNTATSQWNTADNEFAGKVQSAGGMYDSTEDENTANMTSAGSSQLGGSGSQDMGSQLMQQMSQVGQQLMQPLSMIGEMAGQLVEPLEEGLQQVMQMAQQGGMGQQNPEQQQDQQQAGGAGGADGKHDGKDKGKGDLNDRVDKLEERTGKLEAESPVHHGIQSGAQGGPAQQGAAPMGGGVGGAMPRHAQSGQRGSIPVNPLEGPPAEGGHVEFDPHEL